MFKSYLKSALRHLVRYKTFTLINILGLAIGLTCGLLIFLYVSTELSYDKHHPGASEIYRLAVNSTMGENQFQAAVTGGPLAQTLQNELPEVVSHTRIREGRPTLLSTGSNSFYEENILYADSNFFSLFGFDLIRGKESRVLVDPKSIVLKEEIATKFFGKEDPIGKQIKWNNRDNYTVTGIIREVSKKSHLDFDILVSFSTLYENERFKSLLQSYFAYTTLNYIKVTPGSQTSDLEAKIGGVVDKYMGDGLAEYDGKYEVFLQPVTKIYLHSDLLHELKLSSDINRIYIFSGIAILILIIASINFVNLSTARSLVRSMEVGLRKVFGADRTMIFRQYMMESVLTVLISTFLAMILLEVFLPVFNQLSGNDFQFVDLLKWKYLLAVLFGIGTIGFFAGIYPAVYLSRFKPIVVLRKYIGGGSGRSYFRNTLVVIQFMIAVFLLGGTLLINKQLNFLESKDLGVDQRDILVLSLRSPKMLSGYQSLKAEMNNIPGVSNVTGSSAYLGNFQQRRGFYKEGAGIEDMVLTLNLQVDPNYMEFFQSKIIQGRSFFENSKADSNAIVINEAYQKQLGWERPVGKKIMIPGQTEAESVPLRIVGVVKDFNFASLHQEVKPLIIMNDENMIRFLSLKIDGRQSDQVIALIENKWQGLYPDYPFEYFMQQSIYDELYRPEVNMASLFRYFSLLALLIAVIGLLGLSSYSAEQRTREIGIRKVLGSSVKQILILITRDFSIWILLAIIIAVPITYIAMDRWLSHFAFHTSISWDIFVVSALIAFIVAYVTVFLQAFRASRANPIDSLKYE